MPPSVGDGAVSDIVATMLLLGITVVIVGTAAVQVQSLSSDAPEAPRLDMLVFAQAGRSDITLLHAGGSSLDAGELRALVIVNGQVWYDSPPGAAGNMWAVGDRLRIAGLPAPLPPGAHVAVTIAHRLAGGVLADAQTVAESTQPPAPSTAPGFLVDVTLAGGASEIILEAPAGLLVEAAVVHPEGRKFVRFAYADFSGFDGVDWEELRDDGSIGDRVAGDGVFSSVTLVPTNFTSGMASVTVTAVDFNGTRASATSTITILARGEVTETALNPTGTPAPGGAICPDGNAAIRSVLFRVNGEALIPALSGRVHQGDHIEAIVTLADGCSDIPLTLATYTASGPAFSWENAQDQALHDSDTVAARARQTIIEVDVPFCYFAIDLVRGPVLASFGPPSSDNYYSRQGILIDSDNGGTLPCNS